ncbi:hypothetical protein C4K04_2272 [Pseudomonas chlororaphis]|uniref:Uncharacterized protein n=1 Tax=Pseudomonas chlororaphis TaxID=587753 RepID=A0A3G7TLI3_9PSED|nr:hypothetical protein C4K04_2272 [Pseudomonas chlororaphis]
MVRQGSGSTCAGVGRARILRCKTADESMRGGQGPLRHQLRAGFGRNGGVRREGRR